MLTKECIESCDLICFDKVEFLQVDTDVSEEHAASIFRHPILILKMQVIFFF
jgi:hypothetical protein